jgi:hypothetical protein
MMENASVTMASSDGHAIPAWQKLMGTNAGVVVMRRRLAAETVAAPMRVSVTALMAIQGTVVTCASVLGLAKTAISPAATRWTALGADGVRAMGPASVSRGTRGRIVRCVSRA